MALNITRTTYRVADFLSWQQSNQLRLSPAFQRRSVWNVNQKSFLIDTVVRGLPVPIVFLRDSLSLESHRSIKEIVDGQQRLRTLLAFIDPSSLPDFDHRDEFVVRSIHNRDIAGKSFDSLPAATRRDILSYEISTHVLPLDFEDRDILQVFARMNSTGLRLNPQELRNAAFAGVFKSLSYELAAEQLDRWRAWKIFSEDQLSRMKEVEFVSDALLNMEEGLSGKSQPKLDSAYKNRDDDWAGAAVAADRFRHTMETLAGLLGEQIEQSAWRSEVNFFTLFVVIYDLEWGLGSSLTKTRARRLVPSIRDSVERIGWKLSNDDVPARVLDAVQRASADLGRRRTRFEFVKNALEARE